LCFTAASSHEGRLPDTCNGFAGGFGRRSSPGWLNLHGRNQIVARIANSCVGLDLVTQQVLWRYPFQLSYSCNNAQPLLWKNRIFISSPANKGCMLMEFKPRPVGEGFAFDVGETWDSLGPKSVMRNYVCTSILHGDHQFGIDVSNWGPVAHLNCVDISTGRLVWQKTRFDDSAVGSETFAMQRSGIRVPSSPLRKPRQFSMLTSFFHWFSPFSAVSRSPHFFFFFAIRSAIDSAKESPSRTKNAPLPR
jgi:hypothetical protein